MADLIARALGRAALRTVAPEQKERLLNVRRDRVAELAAMGAVLHEDILSEATCTADIVAERSRVHELNCCDDLAAVISVYYPELLIFGPELRDRIGEMGRAFDAMSRLLLKYGWHDASKLVPNHSRHVLVWTQRGEYRAYYDHVYGCWRCRRDGLKITHWREQCGPDNWPAAK